MAVHTASIAVLPSAQPHPVPLTVLTVNTHKGFDAFGRRFVLHELRDAIRAVGADLVFLQEVLGDHRGHASRVDRWPASPQYEFLADSLWPEFAYGRNAAFPGGHHGNALLSRFPIVAHENQDISAHAFESRGLLHCEVRVPGVERPVHCVCVHLGLTAGSRRRQMAAIVARLDQLAPDGAPLIIAGDFNDWRNHADEHLLGPLGLSEVFTTLRGRPARSFPSTLPVLRLDRIYVRGFAIDKAEVHYGPPWSRISDHAALTALLRSA